MEELSGVGLTYSLWESYSRPLDTKLWLTVAGTPDFFM